MRERSSRTPKSEEIPDGGVDADVGNGIAAYEVEVAVAHGEINEAADVIVLVERGEKFHGFFGVEGKRFQCNRVAPLFGE